MAAQRICPLDPGSRAWAYLRHSGGEEQDIGSQRRAVEEFCSDNGLILTRAFVDEGIAGSSTAPRDAFNQMIYLARQQPRPADGLVLWSFSRFARDFDDAQYYKADLRRLGWVIISVTDRVRGDDLNSRLFEAVIDWKNAVYLQDLSRNVKRGLHDLARAGYAPGGMRRQEATSEKSQRSTEAASRTRFRRG